MIVLLLLALFAGLFVFGLGVILLIDWIITKRDMRRR